MTHKAAVSDSQSSCDVILKPLWKPRVAQRGKTDYEIKQDILKELFTLNVYISNLSKLTDSERKKEAAVLNRVKISVTLPCLSAGYSIDLEDSAFLNF